MPLTPDSLIERYAEARTKLGHVKAWDPVAISGERCRRCGGGPSTVVHLRKKEPGKIEKTRRVCATCREAWSGEHRHVIRGEVRVPPRIGGYERAIASTVDDWHQLRDVAETVPPYVTRLGWRFIIEGWILLLHSVINGAAGVCAAGRELHPELGEWSLREVECGHQLGVAWVDRRLKRVQWREEEREVSHPETLERVAEAASRLGVAPRTVRKWIHKGYLDAVPIRPGAKRITHLVRKSSVNALLARRDSAGSSAGDAEPGDGFGVSYDG